MWRIEVSVGAAVVLLAAFVSQGVAAQTLRDPTRPGGGETSAVAAVQGQQLILNSLMIADDAATAVINNKMFRRGDRVQGVKITRITQQGVWLADGRRLTLYPAVTNTKGQ